MDRRIPIPGSFYRHFKGKIYQIRDIAVHSETGEIMVVYQAMYPPFGTWVRPLTMFLEKVDMQKYPDAKQANRFEQVAIKAPAREQADNGEQTAGMPPLTQEIPDDVLKKILLNGQAEKLLSSRMTDEEIARRGFLTLLDAPTFREKRQILAGLKPYLQPIHLSNIAVALDIVLEDGSTEEQYETILHCLQMFEKYEGGRLRQ